MSRALPTVLARWFDHDALQAHASTLIVLRSDGHIEWVNDAWRAFATANGGTDVLVRFGVGSCYFDGIADELRAHYRSVFLEVLASQRIFEQDYECSSPDELRLMHMRALPLSDACLLLEHSLLSTAAHERPAQGAFADLYLSASGLIVQCSNCRRVRRAGTMQWDWVPSWAAKSPTPTSHGLCDVCLGYYLRPSISRRR